MDTIEPAAPAIDTTQLEADAEAWRREWIRRLGLATATAKDLAKLMEAELEAAKRGATSLTNCGPRPDVVNDCCQRISALETYFEGYSSLRWPGPPD